jgi:cold shock CspA family protein
MSSSNDEIAQRLEARSRGFEVGQHVVGTVRTWYRGRGYGFIRMQAGNLFIHRNHVPDRADLEVGERIAAVVGMNRRTNKLEAATVVRLDYRDPHVSAEDSRSEIKEENNR